MIQFVSEGVFCNVVNILDLGALTAFQNSWFCACLPTTKEIPWRQTDTSCSNILPWNCKFTINSIFSYLFWRSGLNKIDLFLKYSWSART